MEARGSIQEHHILEQFYDYILRTSKRFCKGSNVDYRDLANDVYLAMSGININKLTKILYDGGTEAYIYFVCRSEVKKYRSFNSRHWDILDMDVSISADIFEKFYTLNDEEIKFLCILATSDNKGELYKKLPRRYCDMILNQLKNKLI